MSDNTDFVVRFERGRQFNAAMAKAPTVIREELLTCTDRLTLSGVGIVKGLVHVRSGHLRRSFAHRPATFSGGSATGSFGTAVPYARAEEGRGGGHAFFRRTLGVLRPLIRKEYAAGLQRAINRIGLP